MIWLPFVVSLAIWMTLLWLWYLTGKLEGYWLWGNQTLWAIAEKSHDVVDKLVTITAWITCLMFLLMFWSALWKVTHLLAVKPLL